MPAVEVLVVTGHVRQLIEANQLNGIAEAITKGEFYGMQSFNQSLAKLYRAGLATEQEVLAAATSPDDLRMAIRGIVA